VELLEEEEEEEEEIHLVDGETEIEIADASNSKRQKRVKK
jgi:hypothetical protein